MNMETERLKKPRDVVRLGHLRVVLWHPRKTESQSQQLSPGRANGTKTFLRALSDRCRNLHRFFVGDRKTNIVQLTQPSKILVPKEISSYMSHWKLLFKKQVFIFLL